MIAALLSSVWMLPPWSLLVLVFLATLLESVGTGRRGTVR